MLSSPAEDVLARAAEAGIVAVVTIGESLASSAAGVELAEQHDGSDGLPGVWATVGVHPHNAKDYDGDAEDELRQMAAHPRVVAIGETGLDFHYDHSPRADQLRAFRAQLALAAGLDKPVVIHDREAHEEVADIVSERLGPAAWDQAPRGAVIHCFSGDAELAARFVELGCYVAVGGVVTFDKADSLRRVAAALPLDRLLLETDAPFLSPAPHRGKENEPERVAVIARAVSEVRTEGLHHIAAATTKNARAFFGI
jgi:TatD DNase family protein